MSRWRTTTKRWQRSKASMARTLTAVGSQSTRPAREHPAEPAAVVVADLAAAAVTAAAAVVVVADTVVVDTVVIIK